MSISYRKTGDLIKEHVGDSNQSRACIQFLLDNRDLLAAARGSANNHQNWPGGLADHICETMNIACVLFPTLKSICGFQFSLGQALVVLLLHDLDKLAKYAFNEQNQRWEIVAELQSKEAQHEFRTAKIKQYGFELSEEQGNALRYVEGELDDYSPYERKMGVMAAFCQICDLASARMRYDCPKEGFSDPWFGAQRFVNFF